MRVAGEVVQPGDWDWLKLLEHRSERSFSCRGTHSGEELARAALYWPPEIGKNLSRIHSRSFLRRALHFTTERPPADSQCADAAPRMSYLAGEGFPARIDHDPFEKSASADSTVSRCLPVYRVN